MSNKFTSALTYFDELAKSSEFLYFLLNHISTSILILNKDLELQAFNEPMQTLFGNKKNEDLLYVRCGEAIGCAHQVESQQQCGETNHCKSCRIRIDSIEAYATRQAIFNKPFVRHFYKADGTKELKNLMYTIKPLYFDKHYYLLVLIEDMTEILKRQNDIRKNANLTYLD
jgi:sigma-B regulation protein RsbU (phosphoserine phosphatase)